MKRVIAIMLLLSFISSTTELHEFLKLPHLVHHFFEHRNQNPAISIVDYLHEHYAHDHENHDDKHHDKGCLPFQGEHNCQVNHSLCLYDMPVSLQFPPDIYVSAKNTITADSPVSSFLSKIWQPPKV